MGKTAMLLNIAAHQKFPVGIFSLEMSTPELMLRMTAANGMDYGKLRHPRSMSQDDWALFARCSGAIRSDLQIVDTGGLSIGALESEAYRMVHGKGVRLLAVDYVQLITCPAESRLQEVSQISRRLKSLAKNLAVPIIALCQLNRAIEGRGLPRPRLSDLRETGQLEQDADQIIFIDRPEVHMPGERVGEADLYVAKNRAGPIMDVRCTWNGRFQRFAGGIPS
jgi:replicative DNA helicase